MSKYQEALKEIIDYGVTGDFYDHYVRGDDEYNVFLILQELIDRATPMKPKSRDGYFAKCPNCDIVVSESINFICCTNCRQAIKWEENK